MPPDRPFCRADQLQGHEEVEEDSKYEQNLPYSTGVDSGLYEDRPSASIFAQIGEERPCSLCGLFEDSADYLSGIQQIFQYCGLAKFSRELCSHLIMMTFGLQIQWTLDQLILFELCREGTKDWGTELAKAACYIKFDEEHNIFNILFEAKKYFSRNCCE